MRDGNRILYRDYICAPTTVLIYGARPLGLSEVLTVTHLKLDSKLALDQPKREPQNPSKRPSLR